MVQKKAGTGVKNKALYKRLRNLGVSTKESARVANTGAKTSRKKASQRGGTARSYADWKVPELRAKKWHQRPVSHEQEVVKALRPLACAIPHPAGSGFAEPSRPGRPGPGVSRGRLGATLGAS